MKDAYMHPNQTDGGNSEWIHVLLLMHRTHSAPSSPRQSRPIVPLACLFVPAGRGEWKPRIGASGTKTGEFSRLVPQGAGPLPFLGYGICRVLSLLRLHPGWRCFGYDDS